MVIGTGRWIAAAAILAAAGPARADVVELRNGASLEGVVEEENAVSVTLRMEGGRVTFERRLVAAIRKEPLPAAAAPGAPAPAAAAPAPAPGAILPAKDDWLLLWGPERRAGWRRSEVRRSADGSLLVEETTTLLGPDGRILSTERIVEESGPGEAPRGFLHVLDAGDRSFSRVGRFAAGRLEIETSAKGETAARSFPLPGGFLLPRAARFRALAAAGAAPGEAWKGPTWDYAAAAVVEARWSLVRREKGTREGSPVEVAVLLREGAGRAGEERVAADGRLLGADPDGAGLAPVASTRARVEALAADAAAEETPEERRGRASYYSPEDGFRIRRPGVSWEIAVPVSRDAKERAVVRDFTGAVSLSVVVLPLGDAPEPDPAAVRAALEKHLREAVPDLAISAEGTEPLLGGRYPSLSGAGTMQGDPVGLFAVAAPRGGRLWILLGRAPKDTFEAARPWLARILEGFEWI